MVCGTQARHTLAVGEDLQRCVQSACNSFGVWISLSQLWQLASAVLSLPCLQRFRSHQEYNHTSFLDVPVAYALGPCLRNRFRMHTRNGKGVYAGVVLD